MTGVRRKVILVDDVNFVLKMGKQKLQEYYEVFIANSVDRMFALLENVTPDVILLDINMPDVNGFTAIEQLKADPRFADIPVIFLTAKSDEDSVVQGIGLGATDYVTKPFSAFTLHERIETLLDPDYHVKMQKEEEMQKAKRDNKPCIVAVDDVPHMLRSIQYALRSGFYVETLSKPEMLEEFLQKLKKTPELFILDFNMPIINGYDLFLKIREFPEHESTPIIFLTSEGTIDNVTAAINIGASDFIVKPFSPATLREKVSKHIYAKHICTKEEPM